MMIYTVVKHQSDGSDSAFVDVGSQNPIQNERSRIYYVFACDEWKSKNSMSLILLTTSKEKLKEFLAEGIKTEQFFYSNAENTAEQQTENFLTDWDTETSSYINGKLLYAMFSYAYDGEVL